MPYRNLAQGLETPVVAFDGDRLLALGPAREVALAVKRRIAADPDAQVLVFDDATARPVEIDYEGSDEDVLRFVESWGELARRPGPTTPVAREVTLLPRHWEWLDEQDVGASATLRRLIDSARKSPEESRRRALDAAYRFVLTMAGDLPGFEEASRALFIGNHERFVALTEAWPTDVRDRAQALMRRALDGV